jgi:hypothetical protein
MKKKGKKKVLDKVGMVVHVCTLSTREPEAGGSQVQDSVSKKSSVCTQIFKKMNK